MKGQFLKCRFKYADDSSSSDDDNEEGQIDIMAKLAAEASDSSSDSDSSDTNQDETSTEFKYLEESKYC